MALDPQYPLHSSLSNLPFLRVKNLFVLSVFLIGRKKRVSLQVFLLVIYCLLLTQRAQKVSFCKKFPHRRCPLYKVDYETIFLELLGRMFSRKLLTAAQTDPDCLCAEMIAVFLGKTFLWTLCISITFYSAEFLYSFSLFRVVK